MGVFVRPHRGISGTFPPYSESQEPDKTKIIQQRGPGSDRHTANNDRTVVTLAIRLNSPRGELPSSAIGRNMHILVFNS